RLLGNLFEIEALGTKEIKGIAEPVRAWAALRASSVESRFEALHATGLTTLVGREEETELLLRRWSRAKSGEGEAELLTGVAGIGKSRFTSALLESVAREPHTRLRYFCSPQHTDSAFYPIIGQTERAAGLLHDDTAQQKLDKLRCSARADFNLDPKRRARCRNAVAAERWPISCARTGAAAAPAKNAGSVHRTNGGAVAAKTCADDLRGYALGRPDQLGSIWSGRGPNSDS